MIRKRKIIDSLDVSKSVIEKMTAKATHWQVEANRHEARMNDALSMLSENTSLLRDLENRNINLSHLNQVNTRIIDQMNIDQVSNKKLSENILTIVLTHENVQRTLERQMLKAELLRDKTQDALDKSLEQLQIEIKRRERSDRHAKETGRRAKETQKELEDTAEVLHSTVEKLKSTEQELETLQKENSENVEELETRRVLIEGLRKDKSGLENDILNLKGQNLTLSIDLAKQRQFNEELEKEVAKCQSVIHDHELCIASMKGDLAE